MIKPVLIFKIDEKKFVPHQIEMMAKQIKAAVPADYATLIMSSGIEVSLVHDKEDIIRMFDIKPEDLNSELLAKPFSPNMITKEKEEQQY